MDPPSASLCKYRPNSGCNNTRYRVRTKLSARVFSTLLRFDHIFCKIHQYKTKFQVLGRERFRAERAPVRADLSTGEQAARQVRRTRGLRGRVQVRAAGQQLHVSGCLDSGYPPAAHVERTVSTRFYFAIEERKYKNVVFFTPGRVSSRRRSGTGCTESARATKFTT